MKNTKFTKLSFYSYKAKINFRKLLKRKRIRKKRLKQWLNYMSEVRSDIKLNGFEFSQLNRIRSRLRKFNRNTPRHGHIIDYIHSKAESFSRAMRDKTENGYFEIPVIFSLTENDVASFNFLKRLFNALYYQPAQKIVFDYKNCQRIDLDASVCMDILLAEFIRYFDRCNVIKHQVNIMEIIPINYEKEHVRKILFSIGAFSNLKKVKIEFKDVITYPLSIGKIGNRNSSKIREVHITQLVEYVIKCMSKMNRVLTPEAEADLFKVIGEVLVNAEEHSTLEKRYSIGYFQDSHNEGEHAGIFNLVILNFGKTIYEMFSDPNCLNRDIVSDMKELSNKFTKRGLFSKAEFDEQTLWTLYALQEGVTSKPDWRRGNGSVRFIESFFNLKGDNEKDSMSYLSVVSGNTRITFDGTYRLVEKVKGREQKKYKIMAFNDDGDIENKPDKKFVTFADTYFPGTIISARICIKDTNIEQENLI